MKKYLLAFSFLCVSFIISAASPSLPLLQAFDGRYIDKEGVVIRETRHPNNYYYSIDVKNNQAVIKQLMDLTDETEKTADIVTKTMSKDKRQIILNLKENNINVGIDYNTAETHIKIYIQSSKPLHVK